VRSEPYPHSRIIPKDAESYSRYQIDEERRKSEHSGDHMAAINKRDTAEMTAFLGPILLGAAILVLKWLLHGFGVGSRRDPEND
jgi:hypothetical protein